MNAAERKCLGEILLEGRHITESQLSHALDCQRQTRERLGSSLVKLGYLSEARLAICLSRQTKLECVNVVDAEVPETMMSMVSAEVAHAKCVLPMKVSNGTLYLAVAEPVDADEVLSDTARMFNLDVISMVAPEFRLREAIEETYGIDDNEI